MRDATPGADRTRRPGDARSVRVGVSLHLSDRVHSSWDRARPDRSVTRVTRPRTGACLFPSGARPTPGRRRREPAPSRGASPSRSCALDHERRRAGHVDHQRRRALLERRPGRQRRRDRHRARVGSQAARAVEPVNASSACRPSRPVSSTVGHVAGLVVGQPRARRTSTSPSTATTGTSSRDACSAASTVDVAPRVRRRTPPGRAASADTGCTTVAGEAGVGDGTAAHRAILAPGGRTGVRCRGRPGTTRWPVPGVGVPRWKRGRRHLGCPHPDAHRVGGFYTWWAYRNRGATPAMRGLALTLLPAAAWLTATLRMFSEIAAAVTDWAVHLVFSPRSGSA